MFLNHTNYDFQKEKNIKYNYIIILRILFELQLP